MSETERLGAAPPIPLNLVMWRPDGKAKDGTCRYVAYIDARHAAAALDDWVGPLNWTMEYSPPEVMFNDTVMWCRISIRSGEGWVTKSDVGVAPQFQKEKGLVSDAFKRAAVAWGVGRNIYDLPIMWASCNVGTKGQVFKHPNAEKEIEAKLKKAGFDVSGVQVEEPDVESDAPKKKAAAKKKAAPKKAPEPEPVPVPTMSDRYPDATATAEPERPDREFRADVLKLRDRINLLDAEGKVVVKQTLMTMDLTKANLQNAELSQDQLTALWKIVDAEQGRMGEPFPLPEEEPA